jgi:putative glycosyltransferase (TIGR04372 family)
MKNNYIYYYFKKIIIIVTSPLRFILSIVILVSGYKILWVKYSKVGHLITEVDAILKEVALGNVRPQKWLFFYDRSKVANLAFIELIPKCIKPIHLSNFWVKVSKLLLRSSITTTSVEEYATAMYSTAKMFRLNATWESRPPSIELPSEWLLEKNYLFEKLGLDPNQPYVCIHARSPSGTKDDDFEHGGRNVDIFRFSRVIEYLSERNIKIFRMGDPSMPSVVGWNKDLYDYAHMKCRNPKLDLVLSGCCQFFVGTSSGAMYMASIFGRPVVGLGCALPFVFCPTGFGRDLGIPKLFRRKDTGQLSTFKEVFLNGLSECRTSTDIELRGYELVENTEEEMQEVVAEMFEKLNGVWCSTNFDLELQWKAQSYIGPGSLSYGGHSKCGSLFLRRYSHLVL